ncbi:MAG: dephospho-CoA kinase [Alphaproteobacteria bacterium]|nr:dephospho-CoA kinase [Alphaproteobacteria bacterium]
MIVGLTGGIATGKTTVTNQLLKDGFVVVDADDITHQLYRENKDLIEKIKTFFPRSGGKRYD